MKSFNFFLRKLLFNLINQIFHTEPTLRALLIKGLFQDVKLKGLEFRAYALISFKTSSK